MSSGIQKLIQKRIAVIFFQLLISRDSYKEIPLKTNKKNIFVNLEKKAIYLEKNLNDFLVKNNFDAKCFRFASMLRIVFTKKEITNRSQRDFFENKNKKKISLFKNFMFKNNIYYSNSGIIFLAVTTSYKDLDYFIDISKKAFKKIY